MAVILSCPVSEEGVWSCLAGLAVSRVTGRPLLLLDIVTVTSSDFFRTYLEVNAAGSWKEALSWWHLTTICLVLDTKARWLYLTVEYTRVPLISQLHSSIGDNC